MNPQYETLAKCLLPTHMLEWFELTNVEVKPKAKAEYDKKWTALSNKSYAAEKAAKAEKTNKEILKNSDYVPEYKKTTVGNETQVFYYENGEWVHFGAYKYVPSRKGYEVWLNIILYYNTMKDAVAALYTYKKYNLIRTKGHIL